MEQFPSAAAYLKDNLAHYPIWALRPERAKNAALWFQKHFPGHILYAVKANNNPVILDALYKAGICHFDVASLAEIEQMSSYQNACLHMMNPVKSGHVIRKAYFEYGVRSFALDHMDELEKIVRETGRAKDLTLFLRIKCSGAGSMIALEGKYGIAIEEAGDVLLAARQVAEKIGVCFHVGSQAMEPHRYYEAMSAIDNMITQTGILPDIIDVGGGFPAIYDNFSPPPMRAYMDEIAARFENMKVAETCQLYCEPGRALVAEASSLIVQVDHRREQALYINDGAYGALYDAAHYNFNFPMRLIAQNEAPAPLLEPFSFYGPTCDSADYMPGPFLLPANIKEGDYIEIGQLGAYGQVMANQFNGFGRYHQIILEDMPFASLYDDEGPHKAMDAEQNYKAQES